MQLGLDHLYIRPLCPLHVFIWKLDEVCYSSELCFFTLEVGLAKTLQHILNITCPSSAKLMLEISMTFFCIRPSSSKQWVGRRAWLKSNFNKQGFSVVFTDLSAPVNLSLSCCTPVVSYMEKKCKLSLIISAWSDHRALPACRHVLLHRVRCPCLRMHSMSCMQLLHCSCHFFNWFKRSSPTPLSSLPQLCVQHWRNPLIDGIHNRQVLQRLQRRILVRSELSFYSSSLSMRSGALTSCKPLSVPLSRCRVEVPIFPVSLCALLSLRPLVHPVELRARFICSYYPSSLLLSELSLFPLSPSLFQLFPLLRSLSPLSLCFTVLPSSPPYLLLSGFSIQYSGFLKR